MKDMKCFFTYQTSNTCKCNKRVIEGVFKYDVPVINMNKGIVTLTKENIEMLTSVLEDEEKS